MTETIRYGKISKDDLRLGNGTFKTVLPDGREVIINEIDMVDQSSVQTITGLKTITSPVINTPTINTPTIATPAITNPTISGTTTIGSGATLTSPTIYTPAIISPTITGTPVYARLKSVLNLVIKNDATLPLTTLNISADALYTQNYLLTSVSVNAVITASGANGLDTGSEAASTWYYVFVIYNPTTTTTAGLLSLSRTAPTLPSGYTEWIRVGTIYNHAGSDFRYIVQIDNLVTYQPYSQGVVLSVGSATSWTAVSCVIAVPPQSQLVGLIPIATYSNSSTFNDSIGIRKTGDTFITDAMLYIHSEVANITKYTSNYLKYTISTSQSFDYFWGIAATSRSLYIYVKDYYDPLN